MEYVLAQVVNGLALGGTYALLATGMNLILLVSRVFQFAYAHLVVMSMYILWLALEATGGNMPVAIAAGIGGGVAISLATEPIFRKMTQRGSTIVSLIMAIGMAMIITETQSHSLHGGAPISFPISLTGGEALIKYGVATITAGQLATLLASIGTAVLFIFLLYRTKQGRAFRAMAQNFFVARITGIPITKTSIVSYAIGGLLAGITGLCLAMSFGVAMPALGDMLAVKMVAVAIFAGLGNLKGGVIAGIILGLIEGFSLALLPGTWPDAIGFGVMIIVIIARPQGLFGTRV